MCVGTPSKNILENLPNIVGELKKRNLYTDLMLRMAIATVYVETGRFCPLSEFKSKYNTSGKSHDFDLYDFRKDLGNQGPPDGDRFKGRGYVQLTGRANYAKFGERLKQDLLNQPEIANQSSIAAAILCEFMKDRERIIVPALQNGDLARARKAINGGSHGLSNFILSFNAGDAGTLPKVA